MANFTTTGSDTFPAGHILQVSGAQGFSNQNFDNDHDVMIETSMSNVIASSYMVCWCDAIININSTSGEGFEGNIYRRATTMGSVGTGVIVSGTAVSGAVKVNGTGGNEGSATFNYFERGSDQFNLYTSASYSCTDTGPFTGANYYAFTGSGYSNQSPVRAHDGNATIVIAELSQ